MHDKRCDSVSSSPYRCQSRSTLLRSGVGRRRSPGAASRGVTVGTDGNPSRPHYPAHAERGARAPGIAITPCAPRAPCEGWRRHRPARNLIGSPPVYVMEMGDQSSIDGVQAMVDAGTLLRACAWCDRVLLDAQWVE